MRGGTRVTAITVGVTALTLTAAVSADAASASIAAPEDSICGPHPTYGGFFCDLNDIAGLLSGVLDTGLALGGVAGSNVVETFEP
jgi:hypothetical protein